MATQGQAVGLTFAGKGAGGGPSSSRLLVVLRVRRLSLRSPSVLSIYDIVKLRLDEPYGGADTGSACAEWVLNNFDDLDG